MSSLLLISSALFIIAMIAVGIIYPITKKKFVKEKEREIEEENERNKSKEDEETIALRTFMEEHKNITPFYLKNLLNRYVGQIIIKKPLFKCSEEVCFKMAQDENLEKLRGMKIKETKILSYKNNIMKIHIILTNYQEEYKFEATFEVSTNDMKLQDYNIYKHVGIPKIQ